MKCLSCGKTLRFRAHITDPTGSNNWNERWNPPGQFFDYCNVATDSNNATHFVMAKPLYEYFGSCPKDDWEERDKWMKEHVRISYYLYCDHTCDAYNREIVVPAERIFYRSSPPVPPQEPIELIDFTGKNYQKRSNALEENAKEALSS